MGVKETYLTYPILDNADLGLDSKGSSNQILFACIIRMFKSRRMMGMACSTNGAKKNVYMILAGKPEGKRPLGRP
jgi:hypothetical protein